jgi:hypothetical protein
MGDPGLVFGPSSGSLRVTSTELAAPCLGTLWERPGEAILVLNDTKTIRAGREATYDAVQVAADEITLNDLAC